MYRYTQVCVHLADFFGAQKLYAHFFALHAHPSTLTDDLIDEKDRKRLAVHVLMCIFAWCM